MSVEMVVVEGAEERVVVERGGGEDEEVVGAGWWWRYWRKHRPLPRHPGERLRENDAAWPHVPQLVGQAVSSQAGRRRHRDAVAPLGRLRHPRHRSTELHIFRGS